jgi:cellulose synthase/poly-beta-1,6-N-acetylglucosamine synthase-like glycosyltransferase
MSAIVVIPWWDAAWPLLVQAARWARILCVGLYAAAQALLVLYSLHRCLLLWRRWRLRARPLPIPEPLAEWPRVTVQLPVYNERRVIERLIDAVARLDYPADRLEIQVLDDSSDETRRWAERAAARHAARGVNVRVLHREHRAGYKAGALEAGMRQARGEYLAVFDSDFVPAPDFLRRAVPHFADPCVGMVQARWGHLNRDASRLTVAQAVLLDSHFAIEHETRMRHGLFLNFNGSAGVWRRACIESAGGWSHDTLTEDLDLSYRAQLAGWRFVYDDTIEAPAELPANLEALRSQQRRWVKGSIQTARKILPGLLTGPWPAAVKLEALVHLTNNIAYPLLLGLLLLPLLNLTARGVPLIAGWAQAALVVPGLLPVCVFLAAGQRIRGRRQGLVSEVAAAVVLGIGLAVNNARAAISGLVGPAGEWERTPKAGFGTAVRGRPYTTARRPAGRAELALAMYFAVVAVLAAARGRWIAVPMPLLFLVAFGWVGAGTLRASLGAIRAGRSSPISGRAARSAYPRSPSRVPGSLPTGTSGAPWRSPRSRSAEAAPA